MNQIAYKIQSVTSDINVTNPGFQKRIKNNNNNNYWTVWVGVPRGWRVTVQLSCVRNVKNIRGSSGEQGVGEERLILIFENSK